MKLKGKVSLYFVLAASLPLIAAVLILYTYLIGGLQRIEAVNINSALGSVKNHFEIEGDNLSAKISRALSADDHLLLQILMTRDRTGQIDQSKLIDLAGEYQELLKLDFLEIISPDSTLMASGARPADFNRKTDFGFIENIAADGNVLGFAPYAVGDQIYACHVSGQALKYEDSLVAFVIGGIFLDKFYLDKMQIPNDVRTAILSSRHLFVTNLSDKDQTELKSELSRRNLENIIKTYSFEGTRYKPYFQTLYSLEKDVPFQILLLYPPSYARQLTTQSIKIYAVVALAGLLIVGLLGYTFATKLSSPIRELSAAADKISRGEFDQKIMWFSNDELGTLVDGFNNMYDRLKKSQQKLIQAEKLAAWNQMARKIAHEIKNPLTPIKISIEDLTRSYLKNEPDYPQILNNAADTIITEIDKLKRIVDEFSSFTRLPSPVLKEIEINRLVEDSVKIYHNMVESGRIIIEFEDNLPKVKADQGLFSQALINIVKNALEASPENPIRVYARAGDNSVTIAVEDNGCGIPEDHREQLFTPYFTTKKDGSGLGLVITQRIIFDHGGEIFVNSNKESGTVFTISLPVAGQS